MAAPKGFSPPTRREDLAALILGTALIAILVLCIIDKYIGAS